MQLERWEAKEEPVASEPGEEWAWLRKPLRNDLTETNERKQRHVTSWLPDTRYNQVNGFSAF